MTEHNLERRTVVIGAGLTTLGLAVPGCTRYGAVEPAAQPVTDAAIGTTADIPVGGGAIFADAKVVVTQPTPGTFKCFSAVCTHQGCLVTDIGQGTINCACHGSNFDATDGAVVDGPAKSPLPTRTITVSGDSIRLSG